MATNTPSIPRGITSADGWTSSEPGKTVWQLTKRLLTPLASLRLTVALFAMSIVLVLVGTLAQVEQNMWEVLDNYFRTWVSRVPIAVFFPKSFFPNVPHFAGWFPFPGGKAIGCLMALNLMAAHFVRFKVQASGSRLWYGVTILLSACALIGAIIWSGSVQMGVDGPPLFSAALLWQIVRWGTVALFAVSVWAVFWASTRKNGPFKTALVVSTAVGVLAIALVMRGSQPWLGDSSLRILWQLLQGSVGGGLLLLGAWLVFQRRAGIVVIHLGVGLLMFSELLVSLTAVEERMVIMEGTTANFAHETRHREIAVVDTSSPDEDRVVTVPVSRLREGEVFRDEYLPFDIELVEFLKNTTLASIGPGEAAPDVPATYTIGSRRYFVKEARSSGGASAAGREDVAAAYVRLIPKKGNDQVKTHLLSQYFGDQRLQTGSGPDRPNYVEMDGKSYEVSLRFKRNYKPYTVTLQDIRKEDYVGTSTPRDYSAYVILDDPTNDSINQQKFRIWMNNPLRYAGETFYQEGYAQAENGSELTTLQLVNNKGWMIPYIACMLVVVGLLAHFLGTLTRFVRRTLEEQAATDGEPRRAIWLAPAAAVAASVLLVGAYASSSLKPVVVNGMRLDDFGRLPIVYGGRVKPVDTLARNALKVISNAQTLKEGEDRKSKSAVKWLLDVISRNGIGTQHKVVRIDNLDVLETLGLERRKGFRYAVDEFRDNLTEFDRLVSEALAVNREDASKLTTFQRKLLETNQRLAVYSKLNLAFTPMPFPDFPDEQMRKEKPEEADARLRQIVGMAMAVPKENARILAANPPLVVPMGDADSTWQHYAGAFNEAYVAAEIHQSEIHPATLRWNAMLVAYREGDTEVFNQQVADYQAELRASPPLGVDLTKVRFESLFNRVSPFMIAMVLYLLAFVVNCCAWLGRDFSVWRRAAGWMLVVALLLHTVALLARIYISGRPPVTNLYSSAVFIGWATVVLALVVERFSRLSIGNAVAAATGFATLFIAHNLSGDGDTFTVLQAVLDTQFWLATHVVCITLGYATTFAAGAFATVYILLGALHPSDARRYG